MTDFEGYKASYDIEGLPKEVKERELSRAIRAIRDHLKQIEQAPIEGVALMFSAGYEAKRELRTPAVGYGDTAHCEVLLAIMASYMAQVEDEHNA